MTEKKKGLLANLLKGNKGCSCGVKIVEEKPSNTSGNKDKMDNRKK